MNILTSEAVLSRTRSKDLHSVKKLNFWASNIDDVSILKHMPNIEILTLSVNNIKSLKDIQNCANLTELYIRNNKIKDLREIFYLKNLKNLKILWLEENECASNTQNYRMTVLRNLPCLQKLDNSIVTADEIDKAIKEGDLIESPPYESDIQNDLNSTNDLFDSTMFKNDMNNFILPLNENPNKEEITSIETDLIPLATTNSLITTINSIDLRTTEVDSVKLEYIEPKNSNVLTAILILIKELNRNELDRVVEECRERKNTLDLLK